MSHTTLAPSEKHLEDWIVANCRKGITQTFIGMDGHPMTHTHLHRFIGRQIGLPSGRLDLLAIDEDSMIVMELKKGKSDSECLAQLIRYLGDLQSIYRSKLRQIRHEDKLFPVQNHLMGEPANVRGVIISQGLINEKLMFVCDAANIQVLNYTYHPESNSYSFFSPHQSRRYLDLSYVHDEYAEGFIGIAFSEIIERWASYYRQEDGE